MSDWTKEIWEVTNQSQLDHSVNHCTLATVVTRKTSTDLYNTFYVHQRIVDTQEGYAEGRQRIARMVATHNALAGFPDPHADVQALVKELANMTQLAKSLRSLWEADTGSKANYKTDMASINQAESLLARLRREP